MDEMATERIMTRSATRQHMEDNRRETRSASRRRLEGHRENGESTKKNKKGPRFGTKSSSSGKSKAHKSKVFKFKFRKPIIIIKKPRRLKKLRMLLKKLTNLEPSTTVFKFRPALIVYSDNCPMPPKLEGVCQANHDNPLGTVNNEQVCVLSKPLYTEGHSGEEESHFLSEEDPNHAAPDAGGDIAPGMKGGDLDVGVDAAPDFGSIAAPSSGGNVVPQI